MLKRLALYSQICNYICEEFIWTGVSPIGKKSSIELGFLFYG
jgi:hypothetical protein